MPLVEPGSLLTLAQPGWNRPTDIEDALARCLAAESQAQAKSAYHALLYAVGNNHAGTYYPAVLAIVPGVAAVLREGTAWGRFAVLEALVDLCGGFEPEVGHEYILLPGQAPQSLRTILLSRVAALRALVEACAARQDEASASAMELLQGLEE